MDLATLGLRVDASGALTEVEKFGGSLDQLAEKGISVAEKLQKTLLTIGTTAGLGVLGERLISDSVQAQYAQAQLEAAVHATGGAAGVTAKHLSELAESLQRTTQNSHVATEGAEAILLTFNKIQGQNFDRATIDLEDLAARMGGDLTGAALQLGKALQDPERGLTMLRRAGVVFSDSEELVIKSLFNTGQVAEAQEKILAGLESRFGGSAAAARNTLGGALHGLGNDFKDVFEITKQGTSGIVDFINVIDAGVRHIRDYGTEIEIATVLLGGAGLAKATQLAIAATREWIFLSGIEGAFKAAAVAGTGFKGVLAGLAPLAAALWPVLAGAAVIGGIFALGHAFRSEGEAVRQATEEHEKYEAGLAKGSREALQQQEKELEIMLKTVEAKRALNDIEIKKYTPSNDADLQAQARHVAQLFASGDAGAQNALNALQTPGILDPEKLKMAQDEGERLTKMFNSLTESVDFTKGALHGTDAAADAASLRFKKLVSEQTAQIDKLKALNAAYGQSDLSLQLLGIRQDANIAKMKNAGEYAGDELKKMNDLVDALEAQQEVQAKLAVQKTRTIDVQAYTAANTALVVAANNELLLANATNAMNAANTAGAAAVTHLWAAVAIGASVNTASTASLVDATQRAYTADVAASRATIERATALDRLKVALEAGVAIDAAQVELDKAKLFADAGGIKAAQAKYDAAVRTIAIQTTLKTAIVDATDAAAKQADTDARSANSVAFADNVKAQVAALDQETQALIVEANAKLHGQSAVDALHVSLAGEAAVRQLLNDATAKHVVLTTDEIGAVRASAEAHEIASQKMAKLVEQQQLLAAPVENAIKSMQSDVANAFESLFNDTGASAVTKFWSTFRDLGIKTIAEMASLKLFQGLLTPSGSVGGLGGLFTAGAVAAPTGQTGANGLPLAAGSGIQDVAGPNMAGPFAVAAVAVVGFAGAMNGLIGATHQSAAEMEKQIQDFIALGKSLTTYRESITGNSVTSALASNADSAENMRDAIEKTLAGKRLEGERNRELGEVNSLQAQKAQQIADDFFTGITASLNALHGPAGAFMNSLADAKKAYDENIKSALALHASEAQVQQITDLYTQTVNQLTAAYEEANKETQSALDVRQLYAQGLNKEATAVARRAAEEKELFDDAKAGYTAAQLAQVAYIQGLADTAAAQKALQENQRSVEDANAAAALSGATSNAQRDQLARDALALKHQREMDDLDKAQASDDLKAATLAKNAAEDAALAWQQAVSAIQQASSDLQEQFSVFGTSAQDQASQVADLYGFAGKTIDEVKGLYTKYDPNTPTTDAQRETNREIADYLKYYNAAHPADGASGSAASVAAPVDTYNQTSVGSVSAISDAEANGILGRLDTANTYLAAIETHTKRWETFSPSVSPTAYYGDRGPSSSGPQVLIQLIVNGQDAGEFIDSLNNPGLSQLLDRTNTRALIRAKGGAGTARV